MIARSIIHHFPKSYEMVVSPDGRFLCRTIGTKLYVYHMNAMNEAAVLNHPKNPGHIAFTEDGTYLLVQNTSGSMFVFETQTFQRVRTIRSTKKVNYQEERFTPVRTGEAYLASANIGNDMYLMKVDIKTGAAVPKGKWKGIRLSFQQKLPNRQAYLYTLVYVDEQTDLYRTALLRVSEDGEKIGTLTELSSSWKRVFYIEKHNRYVCVANDEMIVFNPARQQAEKSIPFPFIPFHSYMADAVLSPDQNLLVAAASNMVVLYKSGPLAELDRWETPNVHSVHFSEDGRYLLVGTWENGYVMDKACWLEEKKW